jgi:hypothetical protein
VDPDGLTWYYNNRTGELWYVGEGANDWGPKRDGTYGFSGKKGKWRNNPEYQLEKHGPIPAGDYTITNESDTTRGGRSMKGGCLWLEPSPDNEMNGRSGFLIHGGSESGDPSEGCIILPKPVRDRIWKSKDRNLIVVSPPA